MIVEDDVVFRAQLSRLLHRVHTIEVVEAGTIREAIELARSIEVNLVVTELHVAGGSAFDLFPHLERADGRIPTLVLAGTPVVRTMFPKDVQVLDKPVSLTSLRDTIAKTLDFHHPSPFSLADYLQLAAFGRHSVQIEITNLGDPTGFIVVQGGEPWTAVDVHGEGMDALVRLMSASDLDFECHPVLEIPEVRTLQGSCEHVMFEAARQIDEHAVVAANDTSNGVVSNTLALSVHSRTVVSRVDPPRPSRAEEASRRSTPGVALGTPTATPVPTAEHKTEFDRLYEAGVEALLDKRYHEALAAFREAKAIRSTRTLEANLQRLASLGVS